MCLFEKSLAPWINQTSYSIFLPFMVSLSFATAAPQCFSRSPRLKYNNLISFITPIVSLPVETGEHDNKKGCNIEKEESGEEGAQPGKHEQGRADQGEVEHGRGGLQG